LLGAGHQGDQDPGRPLRGGPEDRPHLVLEQLLQWRRSEYQTPIQRMTRGRSQMRVMGQLVGSQIEGANARRPALHGLQEFPVDPNLLFFGWQGASGKEKKLRAIDANAARPVFHGLLELAEAVDVGMYPRQTR